MTLTATTVVANGPTALTDVFTVPSGFSLVPGSALFDGQPSPDPTASGNTLTGTPGDSRGTDTYSVEVTPNETLGSQPVSVTATIPGGGTQSASSSIDITDPFTGNGSATTPSTLQPDSLNVSFLSAPNVSAYWDIDVPAGDSLSLDLSDLPADYDMVLYGPPTTELSADPTQVTAGVTDTPPADQSSDGQQDAPDPGTLPLLSTLPVEAISSNRGLTPEEITTPSLTGGTYLVQISGFNGAYSTTAPYALRSELIPTAASPTCSVPTTYANDVLTQNVAVPASGAPLTETWTPSSSSSTGGVWSQQAPPAGVNTLFLIDPDRLYDAYGQSSTSGSGHPGVNDVLQQLTTTINSGAGGMVGAIVPVEGDPQTAADYTAWDANPCSVQAANQVVSDISATVRSLEAEYPTISNIVVVGADDQIPMGRVPDTTVSDNEADYAASTLPGINDQLSSALSEGYFLSDDPYASPNPLGVGGQTLYTPSLAIGRLVETPTQIDNALVPVPKQQRSTQRVVGALHRLRLPDPGGERRRRVVEREWHCQRDEVDQQHVDDVRSPERHRRWDAYRSHQRADDRLHQRALRLRSALVGQRRHHRGQLPDPRHHPGARRPTQATRSPRSAFSSPWAATRDSTSRPTRSRTTSRAASTRGHRFSPTRARSGLATRATATPTTSTSRTRPSSWASSPRA